MFISEHILHSQTVNKTVAKQQNISQTEWKSDQSCPLSVQVNIIYLTVEKDIKTSSSSQLFSSGFNFTAA